MARPPKNAQLFWQKYTKVNKGFTLFENNTFFWNLLSGSFFDLLNQIKFSKYLTNFSILFSLIFFKSIIKNQGVYSEHYHKRYL